MVVAIGSLFERFCLLVLFAMLLIGVVGALVSSRDPDVGSPVVVTHPLVPASGGEVAPAPAAPLTDESIIVPPSYDLEAVASGALVPRISSWDAVQSEEAVSTQMRRADFLRRLLPFALMANEKVLLERARLWSVRHMLANGGMLVPEDRLWLAVVADRYGVSKDNLAELARRIDAVPPSILLAAAARATAWGKAVSGRETELIRGEATTLRAQGLPSPLRGPTSSATMAVGMKPVDIVGIFLQTLNTHPAFGDFRREREQLRTAGLPLNGDRLLATLPRSETGGMPGMDTIAAIITAEDLFRFDGAKLAPRQPG